jgi:predicted alpha/beta-hydrolase family hydrolase
MTTGSSSSRRMTIIVNDANSVSGLFERPEGARVCLLLAPGAGAGMEHPFMASMAAGLAAGGIATLRYQFPYMERHGKRPDSPPLCHATVRAAASMARELMPEAALIAGGKSFGGRMTSQAQALSPLTGVRGLVFVGFPLHPPEKPSIDRGAHLSQIKIPMLFLQGTRDALADITLLRPLVDGLRNLATLKELGEADHSFHVLKKSGRTDAQVRIDMLNAIFGWSATILES